MIQFNDFVQINFLCSLRVIAFKLLIHKRVLDYLCNPHGAPYQTWNHIHENKGPVDGRHCRTTLSRNINFQNFRDNTNIFGFIGGMHIMRQELLVRYVSFVQLFDPPVPPKLAHVHKAAFVLENTRLVDINQT